MFGRRRPPATAEDPSVALVETLLGGAATQVAVSAAVDGARPGADRALLICACITLEDAPRWLIFQDLNGVLAWGRAPDRGEAADLIDAQQRAGGHAAPDGVLAWLEGKALDPWMGGDGGGDDRVLQALRRAIVGP